jgi:transcriptional regulator with XRE-family HTH domain
MDLDEIKFLQRLGQRIRQIREEKKLTQVMLAERSGLHRTFIGAVERGERNLAILNLRVIAKALRVPVGELVAATFNRSD